MTSAFATYSKQLLGVENLRLLNKVCGFAARYVCLLRGIVFATRYVGLLRGMSVCNVVCMRSDGVVVNRLACLSY